MIAGKWYKYSESSGSTHNFVSPEWEMKDNHGCPVQGTINVLSGKWKVLVVWHLGFGSRRFAELRDLVPGISEKVLTSQLRELAADGIVRRTSKPVVPPQVTYSLTKAGSELIPLMSELCHWGTRHLGIPPNLPMIRRAKSAAVSGRASAA
jgi:DNA-binding HxlR family transcriptional regulator